MSKSNISKLLRYSIRKFKSSNSSNLNELKLLDIGNTIPRKCLLASAIGNVILLKPTLEDNTFVMRYGHTKDKLLNSNRVIKSTIKFSKITQIQCGRDHCLILTDENEGNSGPVLYSVGNNSFGQCGVNSTMGRNEWEEIHIINPKEKNIQQILCGLDHSMYLTAEGKVYTCGLGTDGQNGQGKYSNVFRFLEVEFERKTIKKITGYADTVLVLSTNNSNFDVFGWGNNEYGQLMNETVGMQMHSPLRLTESFVKLEKIIDVLSIGTMCFVVTEDFRIYGWGFGQINGNKGYFKQPTEVYLIGNDGEAVRERILQLYGSVNYGIVETETNRLFLIGNLKVPELSVDSNSNEIILKRNRKQRIICGWNTLFLL